MSRIKLLFFATLRERAGTRSAEMEVPAGLTVQELKSRLAQAYPGLAPSLSSVRVAVNREYAGAETVVPDGADVALFPPVSGG
jgi:molybdopterin synthase catalytic subunit